MTARPNEDPRRWRSAPADAPDPDAELGAAVRAAAETPLWDDMRVAHVRQHILRALASDHRAPAAGGRAQRRLRIWALAVGCVLLGAVTSALAGMVVSRLVRRSVAPSAAPGAAALPARHARRRTSMAPGNAAVTSPPAATPPADDDIANPAWAEPRPRPRADLTAAPRAPRPQPPTASRPQPSPTSPPPEVPESAPPRTAAAPTSEAADLAGALRLLRAQNDAAAALARLDEHDRRYPAGVLAREAALARVEALLGLGRDGAALELLDRLALESNGADRRALLARAELRAAAGRCLDASGDFARARVGGATDANDGLAARALYGDGLCQLRAGDLSGARAAFESYLRDFPNGPRRNDVERALLRIGR